MTIKIELSEPLAAFVEQQVIKGGFASPAAYICKLLDEARLDEEYEVEIDAKIREAINSKRPKHAVTPEFWEETHARLQERLAQVKMQNSEVK